MTDFGEAVLQDTMPKVQAWERLTDHEHCGKLTMDQFYALLIQAGYTEEVAQRAANKRGWDRLSAGVEM